MTERDKRILWGSPCISREFFFFPLVFVSGNLMVFYYFFYLTLFDWGVCWIASVCASSRIIKSLYYFSSLKVIWKVIPLNLGSASYVLIYIWLFHFYLVIFLWYKKIIFLWENAFSLLYTFIFTVACENRVRNMFQKRRNKTYKKIFIHFDYFISIIKISKISAYQFTRMKIKFLLKRHFSRKIYTNNFNIHSLIFFVRTSSYMFNICNTSQ